MSETAWTRMGDGHRVALSLERIREDVRAGSADAAERGKIPPLQEGEMEALCRIVAEPSRTVSVSPGEEVIVTDDGAIMAFYGSQDSAGVGVPLSRLQAVLAHERICAADTTSLGHVDYSFKPVKPILTTEMQDYYTISQMTTIPLFYGAQPNLGRYFQSSGPFPNPSDLFAAAKIREARESQEQAAEQLRTDLVYVGRRLYEIGCEALNFDTVASAGDADFAATLEAVAELKQCAPDMAIEVGMSGEFVLGLHGEMRFQDQRLAGLYPHRQVEVVEAAGAHVFGPAINVKTSKSFPWNLARAVTFVKATVQASRIPVHANVGMGVGGVPMMEEPALDCVTRASKALVQIGKADGL